MIVDPLIHQMLCKSRSTNWGGTWEGFHTNPSKSLIIALNCMINVMSLLVEYATIRGPFSGSRP